jgi:hypothetical protein
MPTNPANVEIEAAMRVAVLVWARELSVQNGFADTSNSGVGNTNYLIGGTLTLGAQGLHSYRTVDTANYAAPLGFNVLVETGGDVLHTFTLYGVVGGGTATYTYKHQSVTTTRR